MLERINGNAAQYTDSPSHHQRRAKEVRRRTDEGRDRAIDPRTAQQFRKT